MKINAKPNLVKTKSHQSLQFKIERGVPIPDVSYSKKRLYVCPYQDELLAMKPNAEGLACLNIGSNSNKISHFKTHAKRWGKENNASFIYRTQDDGCWCWRIK